MAWKPRPRSSRAQGSPCDKCLKYSFKVLLLTRTIKLGVTKTIKRRARGCRLLLPVFFCLYLVVLIKFYYHTYPCLQSLPPSLTSPSPSPSSSPSPFPSPPRHHSSVSLSLLFLSIRRISAEELVFMYLFVDLSQVSRTGGRECSHVPSTTIKVGTGQFLTNSFGNPSLAWP